MKNDESIINLSELDESRFGFKTAKATDVKYNNFREIVSFCNDNNVELLIARCDPKEVSAIHEMEQHGFLLMDTLVYYRFDLTDGDLINQFTVGQKEFKSLDVRFVVHGEEAIVENIARSAFAKHIGHYHMDSRLDNEKCGEVYASWAYNCCLSKEFADKVFVAVVNNSIAGFAVLKELSDHEWQGVLMGVLPEHHKSGIGRALTIERIKYCLSNGGHSMFIPVSMANIAIQKTLQKLNFQVFRFEHTFHKWFV